jgi:hypothetical protein
MDVEAVFTNFLQNAVNLQPARCHNAILTGLARTFSDLMVLSDEDIDQFVNTQHRLNSTRDVNQILIFPLRCCLALKVVRFELKDRTLCDALPSPAFLDSLDAAAVTVFITNRNQALEDSENCKNAQLPDLTVPKLTHYNYDEFETQFAQVVSRQASTAGPGIALDYLLRIEDGGFDDFYESRNDRLRACMKFSGGVYKADREALYSLLVQHIGTDGIGSSTINTFKTSKHGRNCFLALRAHFKNESYLDNLETEARRSLSTAVWNGPRHKFTLESYYNIMATAFNRLHEAGAAHVLNDEQKVNHFEQGLREPASIDYAVNAKREWNRLPVESKTFEEFYNIFAASYNKRAQLHAPSRNQSHRIAAFAIGQGGPVDGRGGRSGRGRGRGSRGGRGRGSGRGRGHYQSRNPYGGTRANGSFMPELRVYPREEYNQLTQDQKNQITNLKAQNNWTDGNTPPAGFEIGPNGYAVPSRSIISAVQSIVGGNQQAFSVGATSTLPPPPTDRPQPPPVIHTPSNSAGSTFGQRAAPSGSSIISSVSMINGRPYDGPVFDARGNRLT